MKLGQFLVINGTIVGIVALSMFLAWLTEGVAYPDAPVIRSAKESKSRSGLTTELQGSSSVAVEKSLTEDECAVSGQFPDSVLRWCELITRYADRHNLAPDLVAALIWQESGGNPSAYSRSGAVGLMQVMPSDGISASFMCANGPCFSSRPTTDKLQDPEFNVAYGTKMLAGLVKRYGDVRDALKSYGPMNMGYSYADRVLGLFERYGK